MRLLLILILIGAGCADEPSLTPPAPNNVMTPDMEDMGETPDLSGDQDLDGPPDSPILEGTPLPDNRDYVGTLPASPTGDVEVAVFEIGKAYCERLTECRTNADVARFATSQGITDVGTCLQSYLWRSSPEQARGSVTTGVVFDATSLDSCTQSLSSLECSGLIPSWEAPENATPACQSVFAGTAPNGSACASNADCRGAQFCDRYQGSGCAGRCENLRDDRATCNSITCLSGQICDINNACADLPEQGETCGVEDLCATNHYCDDEGVCQETTLGFQAGQTCDFSTNICAFGMNCWLEPNGIGRCHEPQDDAACFSDQLPSGCTVDTYCDAGECTARKPSGPCQAGRECLSDWCVDGTCVNSSAACEL